MKTGSTRQSSDGHVVFHAVAEGSIFYSVMGSKVEKFKKVAGQGLHIPRKEGDRVLEGKGYIPFGATEFVATSAVAATKGSRVYS